MAICSIPDCTAHYACRMRDKGLSISPAAMPTRHNRKAPQRHRFNQWEKGVAGEHRADGSFMPYFDGTGDPIRMKRYTENRAKYDSIRDRQMAVPASTGD